MNYSTFDKNIFYIKKESTLPELKYPLIQQVREKYDITDDMLENVAVTFSMINHDGLYRIANSPANLVISENRAEEPDEVKYTLMFRFKEYQTKRVGRFKGEFVIDFLGENCGKIKFPVDGHIDIVISDSTTKTTVI